MTSYCDIAPGHEWHGPYHDTEYGFPLADDRALFGRLVLEINQAGLNWLLILKKQVAFSQAFDDFDIDKVAEYGPRDVERLLADERIIRNRLKVSAVIHNAGVLRSIRDDHGSFAAWLNAHHPLAKAEWVKLFKKTFKFTGGEITGEFLMSTGYLPGAHVSTCPIFAKIEVLNPPWMQAAANN